MLKGLVLLRAGIVVLGTLLTLGYPLTAGAFREAHVGATAPPPNIQVSHDGYQAHAEPSLAVNPRDPHNLLGAAQLLGATRESAVLGTFVSFDGGHRWHDNGALALPQGYTHGDDVTVAFTARGTGVVAAEAYSSSGSAILVWLTHDGGHRFSLPLMIFRATGNPNVDHPSVAAGTGGGGDTIYLAWSRSASLLFSRSLDGGRSFSVPRAINAPNDIHPDWAVVTVGPSRSVHVVYNGGGAAPFEIVSSSDGGRTFGPPRLPTVGMDSSETEGQALSTLLAAATDPRDGSLYVARAAPRPSTGHLGVLVWRSSDAGGRWSAPLWLGAGPGAVADNFQPQLAVDGVNGVCLTYFALARGRVDLFLARSSAHGARFGVSRRITTISFDPTLGLRGGKGGPWWIGDYQGPAIGGGMIYPFWNDTRTGRLEVFAAAIPLAT